MMSRLPISRQFKVSFSNIVVQLCSNKAEVKLIRVDHGIEGIPFEILGILWTIADT